MNNILLEHAVLYHRMGFALFPVHRAWRSRDDKPFLCACGNKECGSIGKHPVSSYAPHGVKDASKDWIKIARWAARGPVFNIGIATGVASGIFAVDIDPRHGGLESLVKLERENHPLPKTVQFYTGGGGQHILFRHPDVTIPNLIGSLALGIDIKGDGGYIVAPPSMHASGRLYAIDVDAHPEDVVIAQAPDWLLGMILKKKVAPERRTTNWRDLTRNGASPGERNNSIARLAGHLLRNRIDPWVTAELLIAWNALRCTPPLQESEIMVTLCSIARKEIKRREGKNDEF